jgi:Fe-S cluster assembly protein SufD
MNVGLSPHVRAADAAGVSRALAGWDPSPAWLVFARQTAFEALLEKGWPTTKQEDWRFTDVGPLTRMELLRSAVATTVSHPDSVTFDESILQLGRGVGHRMVFIDGCHQTSSETWLPPPRGLVMASLSTAIPDESTHVGRVLGHHVQDFHAFAALNTAFMADGAFVHIPAGLLVEAPIFLIYLAAAEGSASFPRTVVVAGADSQATVVEIHLGADGRATLSDAVTEILLEPGARLAYLGVQKPSPTGFHVGHLAVSQRAGSVLSAHGLALDGRLVRNDAHVVLAEEGCSCQLDGVYLAAGGSHIDNQTSIDHRAPKCQSRESYRGVVAERSQAVWSGRAVVRPGAQGTDARQSNRNLVLADGAVVHSKPHLEIFANDVKCSHGATTGRLDPEALFYLRARGIGEKEARQILVSAFLREGLGSVAAPALRGELESILASRTRDLMLEGASP